MDDKEKLEFAKELDNLDPMEAGTGILPLGGNQ